MISAATTTDAFRSLELDGTVLTSAFPGGAGAGLRPLAGGGFRLTVPPDPDCRGLPGYDYRFCVRLTNGALRRRVTIEARMPESEGDPGWQPSRIPLFASADCRAWYVLDQVLAAPTHREFRFELDLDAHETMYCANSLPFPSDAMMRWVDSVVASRGAWAQAASIGQTALGRPIPLVTITDTSVPEGEKDRVLVTSGFHPAEPDWLATMAIVDELTSGSEWAHRMCRQYVFDLVPHVNPDGFDLGTNASNAHGVNMYWDFRRDDTVSSPEAVALWNWIHAHPPDLYVDYHAYVYQLEKDYRPYIRPASEYPPAARPATRAMDRALIALCGGRGVRGAATSDPLSLAPQLTGHFGTITYPKFHMHLYHGVEACRTLGVNVLRVLLDAAEPYRPLRDRTGRRGWTPGTLDRAMTSFEQVRVLVKARNVIRRAVRRLAGRDVRTAVPGTPGSGLPPHWSPHLWRDRTHRTPVWTLPDGPQAAAGVRPS